MIAVVKAPMAKIGDVFGRMEAFLLSVVLYVVGYVQMAASHNVETYAVVPMTAQGMTVERCHFLCRGTDRTSNHATNRHSRYIHPPQPRSLLFHPRHTLCLERMARTNTRTSLFRPPILEMGIRHLRRPPAHLRGATPRYSLVERTESRKTRSRRGKEVARNELERTHRTFICGTGYARHTPSHRRIHAPSPALGIGGLPS